MSKEVWLVSRGLPIRLDGLTLMNIVTSHIMTTVSCIALWNSFAFRWVVSKPENARLELVYRSVPQIQDDVNYLSEWRERWLELQDVRIHGWTFVPNASDDTLFPAPLVCTLAARVAYVFDGEREMDGYSWPYECAKCHTVVRRPSSLREFHCPKCKTVFGYDDKGYIVDTTKTREREDA